jgi:UDP-N-acetylmuramoylalanine--D-glutamate ligase
MKIDLIKNKRFSVLGAGRSGIGVSKLLHKNGAKVFLSDSLTAEKLLYFKETEFKGFGIPYELGGNSGKVFDADYIVTSPGIYPGSEILTEAVKRNIKIVSEVEVAGWFCSVPVIAITGTNGKTTTTELIGAILKSAGFDALVCGNVGLAFSEIIEKINENSVVVLEVSSFQLEYIHEFKPDVSLILNITPDHLDWHGSFENYAEAKFGIARNQDKKNLLVINYDDGYLRKNAGRFGPELGAFSVNNFTDEKIQVKAFIDAGRIMYEDGSAEEIIHSGELFLKGTHNLMNSMAAVLAVKKFGVSASFIKNTLKTFKGVEHRIEFVKTLSGIEFYNDSKATNYDSLYVALESFGSNIILIMGGKKGADDFEKVSKLIKERVKLICATGQSKDVICEYYKDSVKTVKFDSLKEAVESAYKNAVSGDYVLFSPGYKSFDMFDNFEQRGRVFKEIVNNLNAK